MSAHDRKPIKSYKEVRDDANHCLDRAREPNLIAALEEYEKYNEACKDVEIMSDDTIWTSSTFPKRTYTLPKLKEELDVRQKALNDVHELYFNHRMVTLGDKYSRYKARVDRLKRIITIWKRKFGESKSLKPDDKQRADLVSELTIERKELFDTLDVKLKELYPSAGQSTSNSLGNARFRPVSRQPNYLSSTGGRY